jgi:hypothetical protein
MTQPEVVSSAATVRVKAKHSTTKEMKVKMRTVSLAVSVSFAMKG